MSCAECTRREERVKTAGAPSGPVLQPAARRKLLDRAALSPDPRTHRSGGVAPDVIVGTAPAFIRASRATSLRRVPEERQGLREKRTNDAGAAKISRTGGCEDTGSAVRVLRWPVTTVERGMQIE